MTDQHTLPQFRKPPVAEVAVGVQFQAPMLTPVHLGLYYQRIKSRFPVVAVQPPLPPAFETFGSPPFQIPVFGGVTSFQPRMWFGSEDGSSLIQLQTGRVLFNWRGQDAGGYPHFETVCREFTNALDELEAVIEAEHLAQLAVNQCEVVYVNPLPMSATGVPLSEPQKVFRVWSNAIGDEWREPPEDIAFNVRYPLATKEGVQFGRLTAALSSGLEHGKEPTFRLELTARGQPASSSRSDISAFHEHAHQAIVRCFAAITTPEMHRRWGRYQ